MSALNRRLQMGGLPPVPSMNPRRGPGGGPGRKRDYTPVTWDKYFDTAKDVNVGNDSFRVYEKGKEGPVCLFLHGGGFSGLSWACLTEYLDSVIVCRCTAIDLCGHGDTNTVDESDFSAERMAKDVSEVVKQLYGEESPPIILIGHSMGGALAIQLAFQELIPSLTGLVVIDVVEGTALEALNGMQAFLKGRPKVFKSLEFAIEWCVRSGHVRNIESAKVSMVGQLKRLDSDETATTELQNSPPKAEIPSVSDSIAEEEDEEPKKDEAKSAAGSAGTSSPEFKSPQNTPPSPSKSQYTWRIDLGKTEPYWRTWFEGMSNKFLECNVPKILVIAGVDRLDKDLTVGQMQGKFQMQVLPQSGHAVHEDQPDRVGDVIATFLVRHRVTEAKDSFQRTFPAC